MYFVLRSHFVARASLNSLGSGDTLASASPEAGTKAHATEPGLILRIFDVSKGTLLPLA